MAVGGRPWCGFVVYTTKGISVQHIQFDKDYWERTLLQKLIEFYDKILGPEIVGPVHVKDRRHIIIMLNNYGNTKCVIQSPATEETFP